MSKLDQSLILKSIKEEIEKRISLKYNRKRTVSSALTRLEKSIFCLVFRPERFFKKTCVTKFEELDLGVDKLGRNITFCLKQYVTLLRSRGLKIHTLIVLGSRAKGRGKPDSDVDVMIIASNLPGVKTPEFTNLPQKIMNIKQRLLLSDFPLCIGVQPSACCSREEFISWLKGLRVVALDAIYYGKVIYDDGFWEKALQSFKKLEKEYHLNETKIKEMLRGL
jgi:predicted nucleotidyltransferase